MKTEKFPFRSAIISTLVHATEDERKVLRSLQTLCPGEIKVRRQVLKGHYGNPITSLSFSIKQRGLLRELWSGIAEKLKKEDMERLSSIAPERIDEDCRFYLRFDKQMAYAGLLSLAESGDVVHVRFKVSAFPSKREVVLKLVKEFIEETLKNMEKKREHA
jgi:RNA binding exosome subunit